MQRVSASATQYFGGLSLTPPFYRYVFQEELGGEEWTPHLQGLIHNKNQVALSTLKAWNPRIHWEATRDIKSSIKYCSDPEKRAPQGRLWSDGFNLPDPDDDGIIKYDNLYTWQKDLVQELKEEADRRRITWYYDEIGGSGKTEISKYIMSTCPCSHFFSGGNFKDMSHMIVKCSWKPKNVIINLPRTADGKVSYGALEAIKDGLIQSGKYEGGYKIYKPPHVIVMANFLPQLDALSLDRWDIRHLRYNVRTV